MARTAQGCLGCLGLLVALGVIGTLASTVFDGGNGPTPTPRRTIAPGPVVEPPTEPPEPTPKVVQIELPDAVEAGLVDMRAEGRDLQALDLSLESRSDDELEVTVPAGLVFTPGSASTQSMVVITEAVIDISPGDTVDWALDVACGAMHLDQPGGTDEFTISAGGNEELRALVTAPGWGEADFRVRQFAIWTITDDPTASGYVALGVAGVGSGPDDEELAEIEVLFVAAGLDPSAYRALR